MWPTPPQTPPLSLAYVPSVGDVPQVSRYDGSHALIESLASSFKASVGSQPMTRSVGSLMGPGAKAREAAWIFEADFPTLDEAMTALDAEDVQESRRMRRH